jgi:hypothetical protein
MARLLPLLLFLAIFVLVAAFARREAARVRSDRVFRPRSGAFGARRRAGGQGERWVIRREDLAGVRDAYSSAAIDPDAPLYRCGGCQACYHGSSVAALRAENYGRCALCGSNDLQPVSVL